MRSAGPPIGTERACRADFPCCRVSAGPQAVPVAHGLPSGTHAGLRTGRKSAQTGRPSPLSPRRIPKIPPEKRLERRRMSFRPARKIAAGGGRRCPRAVLRAHGKAGARLPLFREPTSRRPGNKADGRLGKQTDRRNSPRAGFSAAGRLASPPHKRESPGTRLPCAPPLMNDEGRRMTPSPFCAARQARQRRTYCFGR